MNRTTIDRDCLDDRDARDRQRGYHERKYDLTSSR